MENLEDLRGFVLFAIGRTPVTLGGVVAGLAIIVGGMFCARLLGALVGRLRKRSHEGAATLYIVEKLVTYGVVILAMIAGFSTIGLDFSSLTVFAGAIGVGVGLGLQGVVKEFVSGIVLIFDRVLNVGDYVELEDGRRGLVQEIAPRAVRIRTNDNIQLVVPNSKFIEGPVINWTLRDRTARMHIPFRVAYGSDREKVRKVVLEAARAVPFTLPETDSERSQVWLIGFGESALNFELLVWPSLEAVKRPAAMQAAYTWAIAEALEDAGIEVPFPQMDVRVRSETEPSAAGASRAGRSNDAAEDLAAPLPDGAYEKGPVADPDPRRG